MRALKAVELDEQLAVGRTRRSRGCSSLVPLESGRRRARNPRALQLDPDSVCEMVKSEVYLTLVSRRTEERARTSQRILEIDPLNPFSRVQPVWVAFFSRRYDDFIANAKTLVELSPNNLRGPFFLAGGYAAKRMGPEVVRERARVMDRLSGALRDATYCGVCGEPRRRWPDHRGAPTLAASRLSSGALRVGPRADG